MIKFEYITWPEPWAGFMVICDDSFCTCFLFKMKDCAGLKLIWRGKDEGVGESWNLTSPKFQHKQNSVSHTKTVPLLWIQAVVPHQHWPSLSCWNVKPCPLTASAPCDSVCGWKQVNSAPVRRFKRFIVRINNYRIKYKKQNKTKHTALDDCNCAPRTWLGFMKGLFPASNWGWCKLLPFAMWSL